MTLLTFRFSVNHDLSFQSFSGFSSRGVFFDILGRASYELTEELHRRKGIAPYSTSPIEFFEEGALRRIAYRRLPATTNASLRISLFDPMLYKFFEKAIFSGLSSLKLLGEECPLLEIAIKTVDPKKLIDEAEPVRRFSVTFKTPTVFRLTPRGPIDKPGSQSPFRLYPLPDPILLARSVLRIWKNFFGQPPCGRDFDEWLTTGGVAISGYPRGLKTYRLYEHPHSNKWIVGFLGTVHYSLPDDTYDEKHAKVMNALLRLAEYTNVGAGKTAGFGMVVLKPFAGEAKQGA
ncbi:MAG: CRISPR system precrRNA processing endoribonuclease RAMP protein Cas6 [Nitrososphaerota archaeon]